MYVAKTNRAQKYYITGLFIFTAWSLTGKHISDSERKKGSKFAGSIQLGSLLLGTLWLGVFVRAGNKCIRRIDLQSGVMTIEYGLYQKIKVDAKKVIMMDKTLRVDSRVFSLPEQLESKQHISQVK